MSKSMYHYGVKGMRWKKGRKGRKESEGSSGTKSKTSDSSERDKRKSDLKNRRRLTDSSLKSKIQRLENEKKLKSLTEEDLSPGRAAVKRIITSSSEAAVKSMLTNAIKYGTKAALNQKFDAKEAAEHIVPKPKKKLVIDGTLKYSDPHILW